MRQAFFVAALIIVISAGYGFTQMNEGGHMMDQGMMSETEQGQIQEGCPQMMGSGMMGYGYGPGCGTPMMGHRGHMMEGMMGQGRHMMGPGGPMGCDEHMMGEMMGYGSEKEQQKFLDDTTDLRRAMHNKRFEYSEALRKPDTSRATLLKLKKEMLEIRIQMYEKAIKIN